MSSTISHFLILWMTLVSYPRMSTTRSTYVSEFEYVPQLHPSRNPDCSSRFIAGEQIREKFDKWDRPSIEIRTVLSRCSTFRGEKMLGDDFYIRRKRRYDEEQDLDTMTNCAPKIVINMRFNNIGKTETEEKFVVVDHVLDSLTMKKIPLQNPYVIKVRQEAVLQFYGLKFQSVSIMRDKKPNFPRKSSSILLAAGDSAGRSSEAREEVINNRNPNYTGCNVGPEKPTCGRTFMRGEPVPFSEGFCCSCNSKVNGRHRFGGSNESVESSDVGAKLNYRDATNKPRNRLRTGNEYASSGDNPVARSQVSGDEARSKKKSNAVHVNLSAGQTIGSGVFVSDSCHGIDVNKETGNQKESHGSRKNDASNFIPTNRVGREKYPRKHVEASSTSSSSLSPKMVSGRAPSRDKIVSSVDVGRDRGLRLRNDVSDKKNGRLMVDERNPKHAGSTTDAKNSNSASEAERDRRKISCDGKGKSNRGFHSASSKTDVKTLSREEETRVARSENPPMNESSNKWVNSSRDTARLEIPFRPTKFESRRKLAREEWSKEINTGNDGHETGRKEYCPESYGDKVPSLKSGKKRNKVFPITSTIDSLAIRPSMHLNEPLKNLWTGVSNSNRIPSERAVRTKDARGGNLNKIMGNTSPLQEIIPKTFNEKYGADGSGYFRSNGNKEDKSCRKTLGKDGPKLLSKILKGGNALRKDDFSASKRKLPREETITNYTPQKRTLKDISCRNNYDLRERSKPKKHDVDGYASKKNFRRSRKQLQSRRISRSVRHRSKRFDDVSRGRGRRKRSKKTDDDTGLVATNRNPGHKVQVYIDNSRSLKEPANDESKSTKLANEEGREKEGSILGNEANRQDSVDKQIEEKFSRISDALKEDTMGSKAIMKGENEDSTSGNRVDEKEKSSNDVEEAQDRFKEMDSVSSYQRINEILDGKKNTGAVVSEKSEEDNEEAPFYRSKFNLNQDPYMDSQDEGFDALVFANQEDNPPVNNLDEQSSNYKTSTSNSELVISPTLGSSMIEEKNRATSNMFASENIGEVQPFDSYNDDALLNPPVFTTETSELTRAVIVVDLFKVATGSLTEPPRINASKETPKSHTEPKFIDKLGGLKKNIEKAFMQLRPVNKTLEITEATTVMLKESTTVNATTEGRTKITDQAFRPSIKPAESGKQTSPGGAEFHNEVIIDEMTFPDETNTPTTSAPIPRRGFIGPESIAGNFEASKAKNKLRMDGRRRKKKRAMPWMIKKQDLATLYERGADRVDRSVYRGNPRDYEGKKRSTRADSAIKFSFEAGNANVVKQRLGGTNSFSHEQRNYLQLRVDDGGKAEKRIGDKLTPRKHQGIGLNRAKVGNEGQDDSGNSGRSREALSGINRIHHPWFVTTETSEYTVRPKDNFHHVFSSKSSTSLGRGKKMRSEARLRESSSNTAKDGVPGRILPPCTKNRYHRLGDRGTKNVICEAETNRRGRRLLSVHSLKDGKSGTGHRPNKDRKKIRNEEENFVKDDASDIEYDEVASEHRKRLKSVRDKDHEKSKKRDTTRSALKRKKENKNRDKKQLLSSSQELLEDYDYFVPGEQENENDRTFLEGREADNDNNLEESLENYDTIPGLEEHLEKEANGDSRISEDTRDYNPYDQLIDNSALVNGYDKYPNELKTENQVRSVDGEKSENIDTRSEKNDELGKDFEISLTGKIHLESDSHGRPVSISFNAAPEFFRKDSIDDGKANGYGNRFPSELANSFIDASDTLVSAGTDNANFLPDVFDVEPSLNAPLDPVDDRSIAREYLLDTVRARNRNTRYGNELNPRQKLLRLQKKSIETSENPTKRDVTSSKQPSRVNNSSKRNLKRSKKDSGSSNHVPDVNFVPEKTEVEQHEQFSDIDQPDSLNAEDRNRIALTSNEENLKKGSSELLDDLPQISLDLSNLPESAFVIGDAANRDNSTKELDSASDADSAACFAMNSTTQKIDLPEITTVAEKYMGAVANQTLLSYQDLIRNDSSNVTDSENETTSEGTTTMAATTTTTAVTTTTPATTTTMSSSNETVIESKMAYPKPAAAVQLSKNESEYNISQEDNKESVEKKNMLAVSEFVKKLERLVTDAGNSSNTTGRTLIHLKKFIIVPDNRTFWSLKEFSEPENLSETASTETVVVMGEGTGNKDESLESSEELEYPEVEDNSRSEDPDLIKEIISSVIRGDNVKREVVPNLKATRDQTIDLKTLDAPIEDGLKDWINEQESETHVEVGETSDDLDKVQAYTPLKEETSPQNVGKNIDDQFLESNLENEKKTWKKYNDICKENKFNVKEKRETTVGNAPSVNHKREYENHGKKNVKHPKKKRRRKRKRKSKKKKENRNKKNSKKTKSKWPFKRNLLMLSEGEQIQRLNIDYGTKWRGHDKFSAHEEEKKKVGSERKSTRENKMREPQIRGGQDCSDRSHPPNVDPLKYLESAHCLRFSDLWYSVYQLEKPITVHEMHLQIYVKRSMPDGSILWKDLTNGSAIRLGTFDRYYRDRENTMAFTYNDVSSTSNVEHNLDPARDRLLVPSTLSGKRSKYSEAEGWSSEYLVVQADKINEDANECDKAGVGFTAFAGQLDRCERVSGTCLKNQPLHYWRHDIEARESGRAGCYFLSNFARVPSEAIKYNVNGTGSREFLALEYHSPHVSVIDVGLGDDYNALLRAGSLGRLTEVHVDNTAIDYTVITVLITNKGSSLSSYRARITDCPKGLPVSWLNAESATKTILPHRDRKVALDLYGRLSLNEFSCSVLLNRDGEWIARRKIKVQKMDRCICVRHCVCSCMADNHDGTNCRPMLLEHYHAAGFRGPIPTKPVKLPIWSTVVTIVSLVLTIILLVFLLLGFFKWMIGICVPIVSRWGLDDLLGGDKMKEYFEKDLKSKSVVFNKLGQPVHPDTGRKSVRICNRKLEFFLNLMFFFIYPFVICCLSCTKPRQSSQSASSVESKASLMSEKDETPTMICVSMYGDSTNSKMEAEDTKYVIDELKKSQESLQNHSRYKRKQSLRERSSSD